MSAPVSMREARRPALDVERIRADFPILRQTVRGRPLAYLDNGATTQKPQAVIDAVSRYYAHDNANVHRAVHTLAQRATEAYEDARRKIARFIGAADAREVVFVRGTTEAINLVAWSFLRPRLRTGDEILVTALEHHSNIVPWQLVAEDTGARLRVVPVDERGALVLDDLEALLNERTRLLAVAHVSNALGTVVPVETLCAAARNRGVPVLVDGAQAVAHRRVDVQALGCDFYAFSGHKMYGPTGIGALWGRMEHLEAMRPYQGGGEMIRRVSFEGSEYAPPPARFEAGTPNIAGAVGLGEAVEYLEAIGPEAAGAHERELLVYATRRVADVPGLRLIGTAPDKAAILSFVFDGVHAHDVGTILDSEGVAVRVGHLCAMPVMRHFGIPAVARASFALYNTFEEVDRLEAALHKVNEVFRR
jgi:cysteine desulfurase/selenocysteine lyase